MCTTHNLPVVFWLLLLPACDVSQPTSGQVPEPQAVALAEPRDAEERNTLAESPSKSADENPFTSERDVQDGALIVRAFCSVCHGPEGRGGRGPNLIGGQFRNGSTDTSLFKNIQQGIPGTDMPAFPVEDRAIWMLIAYIRAARARTVPDVPPHGNAPAGAALFAKHQCRVCHWTGTEGGRRGPDLSVLAAPAVHLQTSIRDPDANFRDSPGYQHDPYQRILVLTSQGRILEGRWLNENGYFVQFMDEKEHLHTIPRSQIDQSMKPRQSLMPSFDKLINDQELDDLIAYLFSLRPIVPEQEDEK